MLTIQHDLPVTLEYIYALSRRPFKIFGGSLVQISQEQLSGVSPSLARLKWHMMLLLFMLLIAHFLC